MISDDDVMRLFEQADPARRPDRVNDHVAGAGYLTALREQRSIDMTITEPPRTEAQSPRPRRWALMGAAAAVAALVIGLVAVVARDSESTAPAAQPPAPTAPPTEVEIGEQFYAALDDRDLAALQTLMSSDGVYGDAPVEDLPAHLAALEAWDWEWYEVACEPETVDADVRCEIAARNRLTDLTGTELLGYSLLTMTDGTIDRVLDEVDFSDYSTNAFVPFTTWLAENHADDHQTIFGGANDTFRQTPESAALLDQHLTEYIDGFGAENAVEQFVAAVNDRDLSAIEALSNDGLTVSVDGVTGGALRVDELPSLIAWYDAFDWRWEDVTCEASSVGAEVECELFERNRLTDLTAAERPATASFAMTDGQIESVTVVADLSDYSLIAFDPFARWVQSNHADDVNRMWTLGSRPILTAESAALFDQHLTQYVDEVRSQADG